MPHSHQQRVDHEGVQLQVYRWPAADAHDKLLLINHGLGEHALRYEHVAAYFGARGFAVASFDHQGHGASGGARGRIQSVDSLVGEAAAVLNALDGPRYRHRVVWGHSMGGLLTLEALRRDGRFAERLTAAVVTSPPLALSDEPGPVLRKLAGALARVAPDLAIPNGLSATGLSSDPTVVERYLADPLNHDRLSLRLANAFLSLPRRLVSQATAPPHTHVLLMHGSDDPICDVRGSRHYVRANRGRPVAYREWAGLKHELHNEPTHQQVLEVAATFLGQQLR